MAVLSFVVPGRSVVWFGAGTVDAQRSEAQRRVLRGSPTMAPPLRLAALAASASLAAARSGSAQGEGECQPQSASCPYCAFYQPDELPNIHQLDLTIPQATFDSLIQHSNDRSYREQVGTLRFNDVSYEGVEILVHGGDPQRNRHRKQSFRLKWSSDDPFGAKHDNPFAFPRNMDCNNMRKMVLRAEWNDHPLSNDPHGLMIRNKLSQDMIKKAGGQTPREDFAEFYVNGEYFGLCECNCVGTTVLRPCSAIPR